MRLRVPLLIVRAQPGAEATRRRAAAAGLTAIVAPIFAVVPVTWEPPPADAYDALMLTSANAARHGGARLKRYLALPVYAVGRATAAAAEEAGFTNIRAGDADAATLLTAMARDGVRRPLHLAAREHHGLADPPMPIDRRIVYAADAVAVLPQAAQAAIADGAVVLLHSPRAGSVLADLLSDRGVPNADVTVAAISPAAAAGDWGRVAVAERPDDDALLAAAVRLCE